MQSNPENTIGLMSMAGKRPEIFVSGTRDTQDIIVATSRVRVDGNGNFFNSVKVAQLALKHRENKNQR
jgi:26S proteasome regulatory subunit N10